MRIILIPVLLFVLASGGVTALAQPENVTPPEATVVPETHPNVVPPTAAPEEPLPAAALPGQSPVTEDPESLEAQSAPSISYLPIIVISGIVIILVAAGWVAHRRRSVSAYPNL